jgi:hypothetical protein
MADWVVGIPDRGVGTTSRAELDNNSQLPGKISAI